MDGWQHGELPKMTKKRCRKLRKKCKNRRFGGSGVTLGHHVGPRGWPGHFFDDFLMILVSLWGRFLTSFWKILAQGEVAVHR